MAVTGEKRMRRRRRSAFDELIQDRGVAIGARTILLAMRDRYPDIAEFTVCAKMLNDAVDEFDRRLDQVKADEEQEPAVPDTKTPTRDELSAPVDITEGLDFKG